MSDITTISIQPIVIDNPDKKILEVQISGQLDESCVDKIAQQFYEVIDNTVDGTGFLVDLKNLDFINSKGIGYFLDFFRKISEKKGRMVLASPSENVLDILEVVGVTKVLEVYFTVDEAKLALIS